MSMTQNIKLSKEAMDNLDLIIATENECHIGVDVKWNRVAFVEHLIEEYAKKLQEVWS